MAKKREPDNLALDMIRCKADGFGCHYGAWKALQDKPVVIEKKEEEIPEGWRVCPHCNRMFKPNKYGRGRQVYCDIICQKAVQAVRRSDKIAERQKRYRERKKAKQAEEMRNREQRTEQAELAEIMKVWKENRKKVQNESSFG